MIAACTSPRDTSSPPPNEAPAVAAAAPAATPASPPAPPPPLQRYDDAVATAATALLSNVRPTTADGAPRLLVIDPLIDGMTGQQSVATKSMGETLAALVGRRYPQLAVQPFTAASIAKSPLVLIGTFTGVNAQRQNGRPPGGLSHLLRARRPQHRQAGREGTRVLAARGGRQHAAAVFPRCAGLDRGPGDAGLYPHLPGTKAGDPINPDYLERIAAAAQIAEAINAYDAGRYQQALTLYQSAQQTAAGDQFRVYNGLYLANLKLGRRADADAAFGKIVDYGLAKKRLAVKFLFRPGSTAFVTGTRDAAAYPGWLKTIATRTSGSTSCLEVTGHSSPTGPEPLNERLSLLRAEFVRKQLEANASVLAQRTIATGVGSKQAMIGNGRDNASDALDRRVEFTVVDCGATTKAT